MIEKLTLTNFRKHEDLVLDFVAGLNVVRGSNEAGKSTLQEAVVYCLFSSKALRTNFADVVTWGHPESSLKVELTLSLAGRRLTFTRGKTGAEVIEDGQVIVTGQNEVSSYAANLLGCDGTAAANLMIASQNAMRGSLEQGPKATAAMIEQLADFDLFDTLLERMQAGLVLGAPATFEARVADAQAQLDGFVPVPAPDASAHAAWLSDNSATADAVKVKLAEYLQPAARAAEKLRDEVVQATRDHDDAAEELWRAEKTQADHAQQLHGLQAQAATAVSLTDIAAAKLNLAQLEQAAGDVALHKLLKALPPCDHEFEGNSEAFAAWMAERQNTLQQNKDARAQAVASTRVLEAGIVSASVCGFCDQDVSAFPEVAEKNARIQSEIAALAVEIKALTESLPDIETEIVAGLAIGNVVRQMQKTLLQLNGKVTIDTDFTPVRVSWIGKAPEVVDTLKAAQAVIRLEAEAAQIQKAAAKAEAMALIVADDGVKLDQAQQRAARYPRPADADALYRSYLDAHQEMRGAELALQDLAEALAQKKNEVNNALAIHNAQRSEQARMEETLAKVKADLADLAFNNALLKKVRAARPIIADKLWNTVLAAVSTMFSQMRGEPSVVSKDGGGFKVNGQPIEALSGSTLDILGLSIRTALVKTFIPHAPFLLLDEAAAACDEDRTGALLGFIAGSGFEQVLLVTHDSASEAIADNVIQL